MPVRVDDYGLDRLGKSAFLAQIEGAADGLLVCHHFDQRGNCGKCEKCLRTALCFIASGGLAPPALNICAAVDRFVATKNMAMEGHTDVRGDAPYKQVLSQRRAQSVQSWLIAHGVVAV